MKTVAHRIGLCAGCGWVHAEIRRVRYHDGKNAIIKALCVECINNYKVCGLCDLCGLTKCDNLYPVSIMRKALPNGQSCNLFVHLCPECRKISHEEVLKRINDKVPKEICDTCNSRFLCFTEKGEKPLPSKVQSGTLEGKKDWFHKRVNLDRFMKGRLR